MENETSGGKAAYIYEIDFIRAITVFSVVALHSFSVTSFLIQNPSPSFDFFNLVTHVLHYNREMFMFVTGLVLTHVYFNNSFSAKKFWRRRVLLVLIPYVLWSLIYTRLDDPSSDITSYLSASWSNILSGNASYQLYFILIALQFYAIFPIFRLFLKKVRSHPWITLFVSFLIQLIFIYFDYQYLQTGLIHLPGLLQFFVTYQDRIFLTYQFFYILGALGAIYMKQIYSFYKRYGWILPILFVFSLVSFSLYFYRQLFTHHEPIIYATSVLQPSVVIYSTVVIFLFTWLAALWIKRRRAYPLIKAIAKTSFGIYFVHILVLTYTMQYAVLLLPIATPVIVKMIYVLLVAFSISFVFCLALLKTPLMGWTIGANRNFFSKPKEG